MEPLEPMDWLASLTLEREPLRWVEYSSNLMWMDPRFDPDLMHQLLELLGQEPGVSPLKPRVDPAYLEGMGHSPLPPGVSVPDPIGVKGRPAATPSSALASGPRGPISTQPDPPRPSYRPLTPLPRIDTKALLAPGAQRMHEPFISPDELLATGAEVYEPLEPISADDLLSDTYYNQRPPITHSDVAYYNDPPVPGDTASLRPPALRSPVAAMARPSMEPPVAPALRGGTGLEDTFIRSTGGASGLQVGATSPGMPTGPSGTMMDSPGSYMSGAQMDLPLAGTAQPNPPALPRNPPAPPMQQMELPFAKAAAPVEGAFVKPGMGMLKGVAGGLAGAAGIYGLDKAGQALEEGSSQMAPGEAGLGDWLKTMGGQALRGVAQGLSHDPTGLAPALGSAVEMGRTLAGMARGKGEVTAEPLDLSTEDPNGVLYPVGEEDVPSSEMRSYGLDMMNKQKLQAMGPASQRSAALAKDPMARMESVKRKKTGMVERDLKKDPPLSVYDSPQPKEVLDSYNDEPPMSDLSKYYKDIGRY